MSDVSSDRSRGDLAQRLPASVTADLAEKIRRRVVTRQLAERIDACYAITATYGSTIEQLHGYLRRLRKRLAASSAGGGAVGDERTKPLRRRQAEIARVLDRLFGERADLAPALWSHRAFLMLMGLVYEKLATDERDLSTDELVKLTKALGDACRVRPRTSSSPTGLGTDLARCGALPRHFAEIVRQVYGTNFDGRTGDEGDRDPPEATPVARAIDVSS